MECRRVLKPGGYVLAFAGTRTFDIMSMGMRASGLTDDTPIKQRFGTNTLQWCQGQGFPKSLNIRKAIEKLGGEAKDLAARWEGWGTALKPSWEPVLVYRDPNGPALPLNVPNEPFYYSAKANKRETNLRDEDEPIENTHPTRKPLAVMKWLIEIASPKRGLVIDPYMGSGTTGHAALEVGRDFIGIERDEGYHSLASKRVEIISRKVLSVRYEDDLMAMAFGDD